MTEPGGVGTEAGRRLAKYLRLEAGLHEASWAAERIAQVEAEATRAERERIVRAVEGLPNCECDWMEVGPDFPCVCGQHNARLYRDDTVHMADGQHARRPCAVLALIDPDRP